MFGYVTVTFLSFALSSPGTLGEHQFHSISQRQRRYLFFFMFFIPCFFYSECFVFEFFFTFFYSNLIVYFVLQITYRFFEIPYNREKKLPIRPPTRVRTHDLMLLRRERYHYSKNPMCSRRREVHV